LTVAGGVAAGAEGAADFAARAKTESLLRALLENAPL